jgi:hypothetical protein
VRKATLRKIERARQRLLTSISALSHADDLDARACGLLQELTSESLRQLPALVTARTTKADAIILTRAQLHDLLARFGLDLLTVHAGGLLDEADLD